MKSALSLTLIVSLVGSAVPLAAQEEIRTEPNALARSIAREASRLAPDSMPQGVEALQQDVILAALLVVPTGVRAQTSPIRSEIHPIGQAAASPLRKAVKKEARLATTLGMSTPQTPARHRNWAARHPVLLGTLVGAGVGLGFLAREGCASSDYSCPGLVAFVAGTGAGIGAAAGGVVAIVLR